MVSVPSVVFYPMRSTVYVEVVIRDETATKASAVRKHESAGQASQSTCLIPYWNELLYVIPVKCAEGFRSGTKISIQCVYRDELVLKCLVPECNFSWFHVN